MKLEDQVCSFEQSLKLISFGITTESVFKTVQFRNESSQKEQWQNIYKQVVMSDYVHIYEDRDFLKDKIIVPSFTVSELAKAMHMDYAGCFMPSLIEYHKWMNDNHINHKTMASLHATTLIHLLENKVFSIQEVNYRLTAS